MGADDSWTLALILLRCGWLVIFSDVTGEIVIDEKKCVEMGPKKFEAIQMTEKIRCVPFRVEMGVPVAVKV